MEHDPWEEVKHHLEADLAAEDIIRKKAMEEHRRKKAIGIGEDLDAIRVRSSISPKKLFTMVLCANILALVIDPTLLLLSLPSSMVVTAAITLTSRSRRVKRKPKRLGIGWAAD